MTKHQTLVYLKYGKLISEINDKITVSDIRSDMIKFLNKFPAGNLIYPNDIYQPISEKYGKFKFEITQLIPSKFLSIDFDGKNNFHIWLCYDEWPYNEWPYNKSNFFHLTWTSIDDIEHYVNTHLDDFYDIIE